jgi:L-iditol 2-dehydrogenase
MNALLLKDYMNLKLVQMPVPEAGPEDVLVRVRACGICGSDVRGFDGSTGRRIPPLVVGHEAASEIAQTGAGVHDWRVGERVTFDSTIYCGQCFYCARGEVNLCQNRQVLGVSPGRYRRHGAFAEYVVVPRRILYRLPDNLSFEHAAMIEAVSVAVHAVSLTPVRPGDTAVVVGSGMIGLLAIQALCHAGCARVIAVDPDPARRELARQFGATGRRTGVVRAVIPPRTRPHEGNLEALTLTSRCARLRCHMPKPANMIAPEARRGNIPGSGDASVVPARTSLPQSADANAIPIWSF